ncbi:hypothetical protein GCM10009096_05570 [Parasphingorhabdus litoris]|uniref:Uncharacterized protein n=1 Tax=Parasphingorhabdus litoris TaxID=394733 RepID=A0ABN1A4X8_9SPHN
MLVCRARAERIVADVKNDDNFMNAVPLHIVQSKSIYFGLPKAEPRLFENKHLALRLSEMNLWSFYICEQDRKWGKRAR